MLRIGKPWAILIAVWRLGFLLLAPAALCACKSGDSGGPGPGRAPVASVTVSPATLSLTVGDTARLTATPRDSTGVALTGRAISWSTTNAAAATVLSGLVTASGAGGAWIKATSEGKSDSASVTVMAAGGPVTNECAAPQAGWIWCDDFEQNRLSSYFEYSNPGGSFVRTSGVGVNNSLGMKARWQTAGQVDAGFLHMTMGLVPLPGYMKPVDAGTAKYREIYWRMYVMNQAGWTGGGADKLSRAFVFAETTFAQAMIAHVWSGSSPNQNYLVIDPARGTDAQGTLLTTQYNDFAHLTFLGAVRGSTAVFDAAHVGQWHCIEAHAKLNDAGQSNGVEEIWIDGTLDAQKTGLNFLGSYNAYGINAVYFENFWNAGAPTPEERYFDNIIVSTQRIGC